MATNVEAIKLAARRSVEAHYGLAPSVKTAAGAVGTLFNAGSQAFKGFNQFRGAANMSLGQNLMGTAKQFHNLGGTKALGTVGLNTGIGLGLARGAYNAVTGPAKQEMPRQNWGGQF